MTPHTTDDDLNQLDDVEPVCRRLDCPGGACVAEMRGAREWYLSAMRVMVVAVLSALAWQVPARALPRRAQGLMLCGGNAWPRSGVVGAQTD